MNLQTGSEGLPEVLVDQSHIGTTRNARTYLQTPTAVLQQSVND